MIEGVVRRAPAEVRRGIGGIVERREVGPDGGGIVGHRSELYLVGEAHGVRQAAGAPGHVVDDVASLAA